MAGNIRFGHKKMERSFQSYGDKKIYAVKQVVLNTAKFIQQELKTRAPADSGHLQDSIELTVLDGGLTAKIKINAFYAIYVNFGTGIYAEGPGGSRAVKIPWTYYSEKHGHFVTTYGMRAREFFGPAIDAGEQYFKREMRKLG